MDFKKFYKDLSLTIIMKLSKNLKSEAVAGLMSTDHLQARSLAERISALV